MTDDPWNPEYVRDILSAASPLKVLAIHKVPVNCDLCEMTLEETLQKLQVGFGSVACLIVHRNNLFNALRLARGLPQNIAVAVVAVDYPSDRNYGSEWMVVGPNDKAIWSAGS